MRLFVAILLSEPVKDMLMQTIRQLQPAVLDGRFSRRENLHLTLAFLGESSLKPAQQALHQLSGLSFAMTVEGVGRFRRDGGDILWPRPGPTIIPFSFAKFIKSHVIKKYSTYPILLITPNSYSNLSIIS